MSVLSTEVPYNDIIHHVMTTEFIVNEPIYQDEKEEADSIGQGEKGWPTVKPGTRFRVDSLTFVPHPHAYHRGEEPGVLSFYVTAHFPREAIHYGWMEPHDREAENQDWHELEEWQIWADDLVRRCDEAPNHPN